MHGCTEGPDAGAYPYPRNTRGHRGGPTVELRGRASLEGRESSGRAGRLSSPLRRVSFCCNTGVCEINAHRNPMTFKGLGPSPSHINLYGLVTSMAQTHKFIRFRWAFIPQTPVVPIPLGPGRNQPTTTVFPHGTRGAPKTPGARVV